MDIVDRLLARQKRTLPENWRQGRECPECGSVADRPKCFFEMGSSCPRLNPDAYDESPYVYVPDQDCHEAAAVIRRLRKERDEALETAGKSRATYDPMADIDETEIPTIAFDGSMSADWLAMTLHEDARFEGGRLANAEYLAVKIASVSDEILARAVKAERERDEARAALRPFAERVPVPVCGPDDGLLHGDDDTEINEFVLHLNPPNFGHLRAARAVLPPPEATK